MRRVLSMALAGGLVAAPCLHAQGGAAHLLIIAGVGGEPAYQQAFLDAGLRMADAARARYGVPEANVAFLSEQPQRAPGRVSAQSTKANVQNAFADVAARAKAGDFVLVLLIGHGSATNGEARFNVPGPDLTPRDFEVLLSQLSAQRVAFVNAASASGDFVKALSGKNRAILTATKSGMERNETKFASHFVDAYVTDGADADKDGRVSVLEAFEYARREVARAYEEANALRSEHALLDDDGDGKGTEKPDARSADGGFSSRLFLGSSPAVAATASSDPAVAGLVREKESLEAKIDSLRRRKDAMPAADYDRAMEQLLVSLAETNQKIRAASAGGRKP
jgi:hypothetical protein